MTHVDAAEGRPDAPLPSLDGRYDVVRPISEGASHAVYEVVHRVSLRRAAAKVLRKELRASGPERDSVRHEARVLAAAAHPGVVDVLDAGVCATWGPYVVLELLSGRTLDAVLAARKRLSLAETLGVAAPASSALSHAHGRGVVHGELAPANVFVARRADGAETVKVIDWGNARVAKSGEDRPPAGAPPVELRPYVAPERRAGLELGPASDVYSLAVLIFESLTGELPLDETAPGAAGGRKSVDVSVLSLHEDVTRGVADALLAGLEPDVQLRVLDPRQFVESIARAADLIPLPSNLLGRVSIAPGVPAAATRRGFPRAAYRTPARLTALGATAASIDGHVVDISESGLQLAAPSPAPQGADVSVRFALPLRGGETVGVHGKVRWTAGRRGLYTIGIEFADIARAHRDVIAEYVTLMAT